jgi:2-polyprenyl-6-methoxyphenol hydroxylase-like FAD-dependent oxidoreductase
MRNRNVLISGAGIAGPALAYWLRRYGFTPTLVERAPVPRPGGQAVDLRGAGRTVVERMGLLDEVRAHRVEERGLAYVDATGRHRARMPVELFGGEGIVAEIEILRGDLSRILVGATADCEYLFGDWITGLSQERDGVRVSFASGATRTVDLVVGADGTHSGVRGLAYGDESRYVRHLGAYTAYFTVPGAVDTGGWFLMYNAPGGRLAALRPEPDHTGATATRSAKAMLSFTSPPLGYDRRDVAAQQRILAERFAGAGWQVPRILDAMADAPDFYFDAVCQVHVDGWSRGRVVLLGDAGYSPSPLTGLGTSLALVGGYLLAGELARADGDHATAFPAYEATLRDYVAQGQKLPPGALRGFLPRTRRDIWLRDRSTRLMTTWPLRRLVAGIFARADAIELPDYRPVTRSAAR